uniref:Uncharacterized protein n=1 Tax=Rose leaf rosette-associated virus TaxID=1543207 RepID=A0A7U1BMP9_9CLOS|nr:putative protein p25 [Rose leaf rosette-associated virus]
MMTSSVVSRICDVSTISNRAVDSADELIFELSASERTLPGEVFFLRFEQLGGAAVILLFSLDPTGETIVEERYQNPREGCVNVGRRVKFSKRKTLIKVRVVNECAQVTVGDGCAEEYFTFRLPLTCNVLIGTEIVCATSGSTTADIKPGWSCKEVSGCDAIERPQRVTTTATTSVPQRALPPSTPFVELSTPYRDLGEVDPTHPCFNESCVAGCLSLLLVFIVTAIIVVVVSRGRL